MTLPIFPISFVTQALSATLASEQASERTPTNMPIDSYEGPERRNVESLGRRLSDIPETLMGMGLITAGNDASKYLKALDDGDIIRLRKMLETAMMVGKAWGEKLTK